MKNKTTKPTLAELQQTMKELETQIAEAKTAELQPRRDAIKAKFEELVKMADEMFSLDPDYSAPFMVRVERQPLNEETVLAFLGNGRPIGEINRSFSGGSNKVKAFIGDLVTKKKIVAEDTTRANGRGKVTIYKKK